MFIRYSFSGYVSRFSVVSPFLFPLVKSCEQWSLSVSITYASRGFAASRMKSDSKSKFYSYAHEADRLSSCQRLSLPPSIKVSTCRVTRICILASSKSRALALPNYRLIYLPEYSCILRSWQKHLSSGRASRDYIERKILYGRDKNQRLDPVFCV